VLVGFRQFPPKGCRITKSLLIWLSRQSTIGAFV
jgi:hypothetical protein